jgi:hypothetical protein
MTLSSTSCERCEENVSVVLSIGLYGQVSYGFGVDKVNFELGKYSIPGGGTLSRDWSMEHQFAASGLGARVAIYGKAAGQIKSIIQ